MNYKKAYAMLVGTVSDAIDGLEKSDINSQEIKNVVEMLKALLESVEKMYLSDEE